MASVGTPGRRLKEHYPRGRGKNVRKSLGKGKASKIRKCKLPKGGSTMWRKNKRPQPSVLETHKAKSRMASVIYVKVSVLNRFKRGIPHGSQKKG